MDDGKADVLTEKFSVRRGKFRALDSQLSIFSQTCVCTLSLTRTRPVILKKAFFGYEGKKIHGFTGLQWDDTFGVEEKARWKTKCTNGQWKPKL